MLLTRRPGESIVIQLPTGGRVEVLVTGIKDNKALPGTDAPKHMPVVRKELLDQPSVKDFSARLALNGKFDAIRSFN